MATLAGPELGRLERVDLRTAWSSEAGDFTPWLAREENLALLGDTIGIDLELETTEKNVGPFRADILARDTVSGTWVLIENQLEKTDHTHLGQILTYAAGLNAVTVVWVAAQITEEHRAALDWLNEKTTEQINFFGLEVELLRIGSSPPAPNFKVVSKPNNWAKSVSEGAARAQSAAPTETEQLQLEYWTRLTEHLQEKKSVVKPQKPSPRQWTFFAIGRSDFRLRATVNSKDKQIAVSLIVDGPDAKPHYKLLEQHKDDIEKEIGTKLEWNERPDKPQSVITLRRSGSDFTIKSEWPEQHEWLRQTLEKLYRAFAPCVKKLNAADYHPEEETS